MNSPVLICPYCNAQMPQPTRAATGSRIVCPRCEESIPWRPQEAGTLTLVAGEHEAPLNPTSLVADMPALTNSARRLVTQLPVRSLSVILTSLALKLALPESNLTQRAFPFMVILAGIGLVVALWLWFLGKPRTNGVLAGFVLANMAAVALLVLPYALATKGFRRDHDPKQPPTAPQQADASLPPVSGPIAPANLAGLGYLPDDINIVAAIHVAELAQQPIGQKLLGRPKADAQGAEPAPWLIEQGLGRVEHLTGLKAEAMEHVVFGLKDAGMPTLAVVVRTLKPYDPALLARAQGKVVPTEFRNRPLYQFTVVLGGQAPLALPGQGLLWCADAQTLVLLFNLQLTARDKEMLAERPRIGSEVAPRALKPFLNERLPAGTQIWWAAADLEGPFKIANLLPGSPKDAKLAALMKKATRLAVGLRLENDATINGNVECADIATAQQLRECLKELNFPNLGKPKVAEPAPQGPDRWVAFQLRGSPEMVARALRSVRLIAAPGKQ
jgi:hypothetical protein